MTIPDSLREQGIVVIGAGNLGGHLCKAYSARGIPVRQIFGRNEKKLEELAHETGADHTRDITEIIPDAAAYFLTVPDDAIRKIGRTLPKTYGMLIHCSGSVPLDVFSKKRRSGVLYPLHSFSAGTEVDWSKVQLFAEGSGSEDEQLLETLGKILSPNLSYINSVQRASLHLAAVVASNFTNHMLTLAEEILQDSGLPPEVIHPLYLSSAEKAARLGPVKAQTGPAVRNDKAVMAGHARMLRDRTQIRKIYKLLSKNIQRRHGRET